MSYYNWQKATKLDGLKFRSASPNLVEICDWLVKRWGGSKVGIFNRRPVRGGTEPSTHSYGAALDWRYARRDWAETAMEFIVKNHKKLGVQMVVDYVGLRIWTEKHGWKKQKPNPHGMGQAWAKWIHVETTKDAWGWKTPIEKR